MNITYIAYSPVPSVAANSVHVMKMSQALAMNGYNVTLLTPEYKRKVLFSVDDLFEHYGVKPIFKHWRIPYLNLPKCRRYSHLFSLISLIVFSRPKLVYTRDLEAAYIAARLGCKVIFERHDAFEGRSDEVIEQFSRLARHENLEKIVVISDALHAELHEKFSVPLDKILAAHDGADAFQDNITQALSGENGRLQIGYTGHLYEGRGIDVIGSVAEKLPECDFHIVGGNQEDVDRWKERLSSVPNIHFYGHVPPKEVPAYIASFDILLAPYQRKVAVVGGGGDTSRWMSPLKIFEYMASGKPVICSDIPVLREVLRHDENCLLCAPEDADEWVSAIRRLADDADLAKKISARALSEFTEKYSWDARVRYIFSNIKFQQ